MDISFAPLYSKLLEIQKTMPSANNVNLSATPTVGTASHGIWRTAGSTPGSSWITLYQFQGRCTVLLIGVYWQSNLTYQGTPQVQILIDDVAWASGSASGQTSNVYNYVGVIGACVTDASGTITRLNYAHLNVSTSGTGLKIQGRVNNPGSPSAQGGVFWVINES